MGSNNKHILLISYVFPPYPGIGGRRWAKFAKYLAKNGYTVHVICAKNPFKEVSLFMDDVANNSNIKIYPISGMYPKVLQKQSSFSIFDKLMYRFWKFFLQIIVKGSIYDKAIFWKKKMLKISTEVILENKIENIIVTGAPFRSVFYAADFKRRFAKINLIIDYRDPWVWGDGYGYKNLSSLDVAYEQRMQDESIKEADCVYAPVDIMVNHLRKEYVNYVDKIKLLPHGFDSDELPASINKTESPIKRILFYGSIYNGLDFEFDSIANSIKENNLEVKIDIYSDSKKYMNVFIDRGLLKNKVNYYSALPSHELFQLFQNYDYILLIHPDYGKDNLSTKFFEIIHTRTPIIYIGSEGKTGQFIRQNDLGYHFTRDEIYDSFAKIINNNLFLSYNSNFVTDDYSFELLTKKLISEFK